ncbi:MAG: cupin domain-containing protein [Deltaproteobacteria bacterium]|nr:cupin domain-containing protein [Deltaproteobacteria bacterium]
MGTYHRWEDFPQRTVSYLAGRPNSEGIQIRILSAERIMLTQIVVRGGGTVPRHRHEAEQIILLQKGEARVTTGRESPRVLRAGDIWIVPSNTMHGVEYLGDVDALEIVSPPRMDNFIGYTIKHTFFEKEEEK